MTGWVDILWGDDCKKVKILSPKEGTKKVRFKKNIFRVIYQNLYFSVPVTSFYLFCTLSKMRQSISIDPSGHFVLYAIFVARTFFGRISFTQLMLSRFSCLVVELFKMYFLQHL